MALAALPPLARAGPAPARHPHPPQVMGSGKGSLAGGTLSYLVGGAVKQNVKRCDAKGVKGNLEGEGLKLGGVWAISPASEVVYEHQEKQWGDIVEGKPLDELRAALSW